MVELREGVIPETHRAAFPQDLQGKGVGEAPSASPSSENSRGLSKTWLQLCSSNTGLVFILIFMMILGSAAP